MALVDKVPENNGRKIDVGSMDERKEQENKYYLHISQLYRGAKITTSLLLVLFIIISVIAFRNTITYDNLSYLIRDLNVDISTSNEAFSEIKFDEESKADYTLFRGRLVVAGTEKLCLYNSSSSTEAEYQVSMQDPQVISSDKNILNYDLGGTSYGIYTALARVNTGTSDYTIEGAALADTGAYALITRSVESNYMVSVYDKNFNLVATYYKDKYVMDCAFSDDASQLVIASADISGSDFETEIQICKVGTEDTSSITIPSAMPLKVSYFEDGSFAVVCDTCICFYDSSCELVQEYDYGSLSLVSADVSGTRLAIAGNTTDIADQSKLIVFDTTGNILYNDASNDKVSYIVAADDSLCYALTDTKVLTVNSDSTVTEEECDDSVRELVSVNGGVLVCTATSAYEIGQGE